MIIVISTNAEEAVNVPRIIIIFIIGWKRVLWEQRTTISRGK